MIPGHSSTVNVLRVNGQFLMAFFFGCAAWIFWPTSAAWWGYGLLSLGSGACAISLTIKAITLMIQVRDAERAIQHHLHQTRPSEQARLASDDALRRAGMTK